MTAKILFVHNKPTPFVTLDQTLLEERWVVQEWYQQGRSVDLPTLIQAVGDCDALVGWFASWHTFWPAFIARQFHKPLVMIVGGYDIANLPEIGYGHQRTWIKRWMSGWIIRSATFLITNSFYSYDEICRNLGSEILKKTKVIHHGVPDLHAPMLQVERGRTALTVGDVSKSTMHRKGHQLFVQAASLLPDVRFVVAGRWLDSAIDTLRASASQNVQFTNWLEPQELDRHFQQASVYVQASRHEGFGLAVAEAMLAGCTPVITRAGSLPEVVGNYGVYVEADPQSIAQGIRLALTRSPSQRQAGRDHILKQFPVSKRRDALWACVEQAMASVD